MFAGLSLYTSCVPYSPPLYSGAVVYRVGEPCSAEVFALGDEPVPVPVADPDPDLGTAELVLDGELDSTWLSEVRLGLVGESLERRRREKRRSGLDEEEEVEAVGWWGCLIVELASDA